ncbi:MAG: tetratricopeptide repeat protein [Armatimonadetes bacterium]|nr:tetratricopeptide repeat protein [Armatimonadota bacterium]MDW8028986.1 tetratricopeptide repeat protein [Armatimonadota bacterium]
MDWQRKSVQRRHIASYIFCAFCIVAFLFATWWVHLRDEKSRQWWQEVRRQLTPSGINQRLRATRYLQDARQAMDRQDWQKAESLLRKATEVDPANGEAWQLLVMVLVRQNRWDDAEKLAGKISDKKAKVEALLALADIAYLQRNWEKAEEFYEQVIKLDPNNATALNNYGYMLAELGERLDEAEKMINKAIKIQPNEPAFWDSLGWVYFQRGDYKKAIQWVEKAVKAQPNDAELRYHLGMIYWKLGEREKAIKELKEAVKIDPRHPEANEALEQIEREEMEKEMKGERVQT